MLGGRSYVKGMDKSTRAKRRGSVFGYALVAGCIVWILSLITNPSYMPITAEVHPRMGKPAISNGLKQLLDPCAGKYVYVHELPSRFNLDILQDCKKLNPWIKMCTFTSNVGLGPPLEDVEQVFSDSGWYATNQFTLEIIFHERMKKYRCLTNDSSLASAIFIPYYAGLDVARYLWGYNTSIRDSGALDLLGWLSSKPEWKAMGGRDHFFVAGRISWDFRRLSDEESDWGNKLLELPEARNLTALVVEASPWNYNDFAIPYPTYFHPSKYGEVHQWQDRMRRLDRPWLFSFAGAPRPNMTLSIRDLIINQCRASKFCTLLKCHLGESKCHSPSAITKMFQSSVFCLQPQGDSYTRRSVFDSMVAGCIPVFFHPGTAYVQYLWHLPMDFTKYSVFISEDAMRDGTVSIEQVLSEIKLEQVRTMREEVIRMIPKLLYADPRSPLVNFDDAFDVAVDGVIKRVDKMRIEMRGEGNFSRYLEKNSWKYALTGNEGPHKWDNFFFKAKQCRPCR